jgi:hypothetical protein
MPRTKKIVETIAEKSGITSVKDKEKEINQVIQPPEPPAKKERKKRILSDEQKTVLRERLQKARAIKKEKQEQKKSEQ